MGEVPISTIIEAIEELRIAVGELRGEEIPPWWDHDKWAIDLEKPEESAWDELESVISPLKSKYYQGEDDAIESLAIMYTEFCIKYGPELKQIPVRG